MKTQQTQEGEITSEKATWLIECKSWKVKEDGEGRGRRGAMGDVERHGVRILEQ